MQAQRVLSSRKEKEGCLLDYDLFDPNYFLSKDRENDHWSCIFLERAFLKKVIHQILSKKIKIISVSLELQVYFRTKQSLHLTQTRKCNNRQRLNIYLLRHKGMRILCNIVTFCHILTCNIWNLKNIFVSAKFGTM